MYHLVKYWAIHMKSGGNYAETAHKQGFIAVRWKIGDLTLLKHIKPSLLKNEIQELSDKYYFAVTGQGVGSIKRFVLEVRKDDYVLLPNPNERTVHFGQVLGDYEYVHEHEDDCPYPQRRAVQWLTTISRNRLPEQLKASLKSQQTFFSLKKHKNTIDEILKEVEADKDEIEFNTTLLEVCGNDEDLASVLTLAGFEVPEDLSDVDHEDLRAILAEQDYTLSNKDTKALFEEVEKYLDDINEMQEGFKDRTESIPERQAVTTQRIIRDNQTSAQLKKLYRFECQICGIKLQLPQGPYAEAAHIKPLGSPHNGPDILENLLCLCPNHHVLFDNGAFAIDDDLSLIGLEGSLIVSPKHKIDQKYFSYHRTHFAK